MEENTFDIEVFADMLGFRPWPYSAGTYTNATGRFLDWQKGERLLGLPRSDLLFSEYDEREQRNVLRGFPAPKTMHDAVEAAAAIGWHANYAT